MKKLITFLAMGAFCSGYAQNYEIKVSYGAPSLYGIAESLTTTILDGNTYINEASVGEYQSSGVLQIDANKFSTNKKWSYGLSFGMEKVDNKDNNFESTFTTLLANVDYYWTNSSNKFNIYSGAGIGAVFVKMKDHGNDISGTVFGFNIKPIGLRYGGNLGVFLEGNIGTRGMLQGGASYRF